MSGKSEVNRGDVGKAADDPRVADGVPVDQVVQSGRSVAAAHQVDHVNPGLRERPLQVLGALGVGPGEVAVDLADVLAEDHLVPAGLEIRPRLLGLRAYLRRARRGDDRDPRSLRAAPAA